MEPTVVQDEVALVMAAGVVSGVAGHMDDVVVREGRHQVFPGGCRAVQQAGAGEGAGEQGRLLVGGRQVRRAGSPRQGDPGRVTTRGRLSGPGRQGRRRPRAWTVGV
ncbi:hypothetical protein GCM10010365_58080 [Streptomyces poonensis]|uniref:Uncharacterized protein n=1 Tax=Streptomyces poonensis TaxID=68255 RepID=A0A918URF2_9ACTN|nr:hypothetical protein GCM10010365_58080 [Streptomyces poonensis]